jgi:hypothetical protein
MAIRKISAGAIIALAATGIFLTLVTAGVLVTLTVPSNGTITTVNVGVYSDSQCSQNLTAIGWGSLYPGNSTTKTIYLKNTGDLPIALNMTSQSWTPASASSVLTLTWDQQNTVLTPDQSIPAILTLTADSDTGSLVDFSFNIVITGIEQ